MTSLWQTLPLEELAVSQKGAIKIGPFGSQLKKCDLTASGIHVVGIENVLNETFDGLGRRFISDSKFQQLRSVEILPGDVLITMMGTIGRVAIVPEGIQRSIMDSHLLRVRPDNRKCRADYLAWAIYGCPIVQEAIDSQAHGSIMRGLNSEIVRALPIPVPSLPEQRRIVAILDEAFDGIATAKATAEKNFQNARALFESHLQKVFTERGEGWVEKTVGELVEDEVLVKPFDGNHGEIHPHKSDYVESGVPFIMACDLQEGGVDTEGCKFITRELADSLRVGFAKDGDVLISHKGTIGRSAVVNTELDYIMLTPQVTSYRVKDSATLLNRFVRYYFMSPVFQREMIAGAADGATRAYIGITKQLSLRFRFPSLEEQKRIVAKLDVLEPETQRLKSIYQQKLTALDDLKKSLLHQAFSGQL